MRQRIQPGETREGRGHETFDEIVTEVTAGVGEDGRATRAAEVALIEIYQRCETREGSGLDGFDEIGIEGTLCACAADSADG